MVSTILVVASSYQEVETLYQMDHNTLMCIAQVGMNKPMPSQGQRLFKLVVLGPCYGCGPLAPRLSNQEGYTAKHTTNKEFLH